MTVWYAHSRNTVGKHHRLRDHLTSVSTLARDFLDGYPGAEEAALAGMLHDLGKYGDRFQARLRGEESGLDHWSQGAWVALSQHRAVAAALAIEGHHIGLQQGNKNSLGRLLPDNLTTGTPLGLQLSDTNYERLLGRGHAPGAAASA